MAFLLLFTSFGIGLRCFFDFDKGLAPSKIHCECSVASFCQMSSTFLISLIPQPPPPSGPHCSPRNHQDSSPTALAYLSALGYPLSKVWKIVPLMLRICELCIPLPTDNPYAPCSRLYVGLATPRSPHAGQLHKCTSLATRAHVCGLLYGHHDGY